MSAAEKLRALSELAVSDSYQIIDNALPQIVAVVEAAEVEMGEFMSWHPLSQALAALDEALK